jgi:hypothetical protein
MGLLVSHPTLKEGKRNVYFLSNYVHVVDERLKRNLKKEAPISPDGISLALIKVSSHVNVHTIVSF